MPDNTQKTEAFNALEYPEGVKKVSKEMLPFLPEDEKVRELFMNDVLQWLIQW